MAKRKRQIAERSIGQHTGYAVEAHFRGVVRRVLGPKGFSVVTEFPFDFPVDPDAVIIDAKGKICCIAIIAINHVQRNSNMKFYRTRSEYFEIMRSLQTHRAHFAKHFLPLVVLYGARDGWMPTLLDELDQQCPKTVFLPDEIGDKPANLLVRSVFARYRKLYESGDKETRKSLEDIVASQPIGGKANDDKFQSFFLQLWKQRDAGNIKFKVRKATQPTHICDPFTSRMRQGLSMGSFFSPSEIVELMRESDVPLPAESPLDSAVRKGLFLDLLQVTVRRSIKRDLRIRIHLREARDENGVWRPFLPDFASWTNTKCESCSEVLDAHRRIPLQYPKVFRGGVEDQVNGNWRHYCETWKEMVEECLAHLKKRNVKALARQICESRKVTSETWQPTTSIEFAQPTWELFTAAVDVALLDSDIDRKEMEGGQLKLKLRRSASLAECRTLAAQMLEVDQTRLMDELAATMTFSSQLLTSSLDELSTIDRPVVLSLTNRSSWVSTAYRAATTNKSHNPLLGPVRSWLVESHPNYEWLGWPQRLSEPVANVVAGFDGRLQWQIIGRPKDGRTLIFAEVRSITENNWGNKSKELFDRTQATKQAARAGGLLSNCICFLDGDFSQEAKEEMESGLGFDELHPVTKVF